MAMVGPGVGPVGALVGPGVGTGVGALVGVGTLVGTLVGMLVGALVIREVGKLVSGSTHPLELFGDLEPLAAFDIFGPFDPTVFNPFGALQDGTFELFGLLVTLTLLLSFRDFVLLTFAILAFLVSSCRCVRGVVLGLGVDLLDGFGITEGTTGMG